MPAVAPALTRCPLVTDGRVESARDDPWQSTAREGQPGLAANSKPAVQLSMQPSNNGGDQHVPSMMQQLASVPAQNPLGHQHGLETGPVHAMISKMQPLQSTCHHQEPQQQGLQQQYMQQLPPQAPQQPAMLQPHPIVQGRPRQASCHSMRLFMHPRHCRAVELLSVDPLTPISVTLAEFSRLVSINAQAQQQGTNC